MDHAQMRAAAMGVGGYGDFWCRWAGRIIWKGDAGQWVGHCVAAGLVCSVPRYDVVQAAMQPFMCLRQEKAGRNVHAYDRPDSDFGDIFLVQRQ